MQELATQIASAVAHLDMWLDTMRCPGGYGGPVAHWWQQSLIYTGAALDWRYEGIIAGYLLLWERTGNERWLMKACRAGDDLVSGQNEQGHYMASAFEINPATAGTPHEAACNVGLLLLARRLQVAGLAEWESYAACAERNIYCFLIGKLWDSDTQAFRDSAHTPSFVPNKAATICDALFLLAELRGESQWVEHYALPTLNRLVQHQVKESGSLNGAIAQNSFGSRVIDKYFPIYIARCIPALLTGYQWSNDERYLESAMQAMDFIVRWIDDDGSLPTVVYANQRVNRYPSWVAPLGDVLRAADAIRPYRATPSLSAVLQRLLAGQDSSGGIQTATGFAAQASGKPSGAPDVRDVLHVVGWCDKAFRYLASQVGSDLPAGRSAPFTTTCQFRGQALWLVETTETLAVASRQGICYRWNKGEPWPEKASSAFWLR